MTEKLTYNKHFRPWKTAMPEQNGTPQHKGLSHYFEGKKWSEITREERFFCQHLYSKLQNQAELSTFIEYIDKETNNRYNLSSVEQWEPAFEVCFYRDLSHYLAKKKKIDLLSILAEDEDEEDKLSKRTFDLCLFSENTIVIIEAKAQQGFDTKQLKSIKKDRLRIQDKLGIRCLIFGLVSSVYAYRHKEILKRQKRKNPEKKGIDWPFDPNPGQFDPDNLLQWKELAKRYGNDEVLNRADAIYKDDKNTMSGAEIYEAYKDTEVNGLVENLPSYVGRTKNGLIKDIKNGLWKNTNYQVSNTNPDNHNWLTLKEFIDAIEKNKSEQDRKA